MTTRLLLLNTTKKMNACTSVAAITCTTSSTPVPTKTPIMMETNITVKADSAINTKWRKYTHSVGGCVFFEYTKFGSGTTLICPLRGAVFINNACFSFIVKFI